MVFEESLEGLTVRSGDVIATVDGGASLYGFLFKVIGSVIPGRPDHIALYLGPDGICVEAGPRGVNLFRFFEGRWDPARMVGQRGIVDGLYGVGDVVAGRLPDGADEETVRSAIRRYALEQAGKPYNLLFTDPDGEGSFYCSQLVYAACRRAGVPLDPLPPATSPIPLPGRIVTPEQVWKAAVPLK